MGAQSARNPIAGMAYMLVLFAVFGAIGGCASAVMGGAQAGSAKQERMPQYLIGPGDQVSVFVWGQPELSVSVPVRPDGRITTPLVEDIEASGKTPTQLAREVENRLATYIKSPVVTVIATNMVGRYSEQIRVIGQAAKPQALPYRENMTVLDVIIAVGGLTEYAAGNRASIVRAVDSGQEQVPVRLHDLMNGDITANVNLYPGDVLIIPEAWF